MEKKYDNLERTIREEVFDNLGYNETSCKYNITEKSDGTTAHATLDLDNGSGHTLIYYTLEKSGQNWEIINSETLAHSQFGINLGKLVA